MTDAEKQAILSELIELSGYRIRQPGDVDVDDYAAMANCSGQAARRRLHKLEEKGVLKSALVCEGGRPPFLVWWKVEE